MLNLCHLINKEIGLEVNMLPKRRKFFLFTQANQKDTKEGVSQ